MENNYVVYHLHSDLSLLDSATKFTKYIDKAKELNMKAIGFAEHGNIFNWVNKKQQCDEKGIKYIHGIEMYVTSTLKEKVRDNYHIVLIARNWEGVKEINRLSSLSYNKEDGHYYYNPRITLDELINTSHNVIITTACLAGILYKGWINNRQDVIDKFIKFSNKNKDRVFLEIQYHNVKEQKELNKYLLSLSNSYDLNLIAGTDTHAIDKNYLEARKILLKAKNINYTNEDEFDLSFKSYNELINMFKKQDAIPEKDFMKAIENTNLLIDMVEDFTLDKRNKYPKLYPNSDEVFKNKINKGFVKRNFHKLPEEEKKKYLDRIKYEYETYKKCDSIDMMLLQEDIINFCHKNNIWQGYSRGSVSGSLISHTMGITDADSVKFNLIFERFMNPERVSLPDIDTDFPPSQREIVKQYIVNKPGIYCSDIVTFNTIALKGAIRDVGRSLEIPLSEVDKIAKNIEVDEDKYRKQYPELFKYVDLLNGVNVSVGSHPSGLLISPVTINDNIGTFTTSTSDYLISQINMKEIDSLNYVKLDLLGLDNIELINKTCEMANIERLTPDNVDPNNEDVWNSILESNLGVFQWESSFAFDYYKKLFSKETIKKIKQVAPNITYMDLFSMGNGALRPAGASYRESLSQGIFNDNGHEALNKFLESTLGYLVYQEQVIEFLNKFCGYTLSQADIVRRGFAKKTGTEKYIPQIKAGFIKTMKEKYNTTEQESEKLIEAFLKIIEDASSYLFSLNHSYIYSYIGYICAYLRYYYPKEFITVLLNINEKDLDKTARIYKYAQMKNINIMPIKFGKSQSDYTLKDGKIYKGLRSVKNLNQLLSEQLYNLSKTYFNSFVDLLIAYEETCSKNNKGIEILIKLNFFDQFGKNQSLLNIFNEFTSGKNRYKKSLTDKNKEKRIIALKEYEKEELKPENQKNIPLREQIENEYKYLGYGVTTILNNETNIKYKDYAIVVGLDTKYAPKITVYYILTGEEKKYKIMRKKYYLKNGKAFFGLLDMIRIKRTEMKPKRMKIDDEWIDSETEKEEWIEELSVIREVKKKEDE